MGGPGRGAQFQMPSPAFWDKIRAMAEAEVELRKRTGAWGGGVRAHTEYRDRPLDWIVEKLGVPEHTVRWSMNEGYEACWCPRCVKLGNGGQPHLWDGDKDPLATALELVFQGKSVAVSSGTGLGKTFLLGAALTLAFLAIHERSIVFSIAPKKELLLANLWKEIGQFWPRFKAMFPTATLLTGKLRMLDDDGEQEVWTASAFGAGVGAEEELASRLKGFHHPKMLWIIEEMQGIDPAIVETIVKTTTGSFNPIIGLGNPSSQFDQLALFGKRDWVTPIRISALDFPDVVLGREIVPGARSRASVERDLADAGGDETDPKYLSQVRGIAPKQSQKALVLWEWLEMAAKRLDDKDLRDGPLALGVDPSDSPTGDDSAISRWQGAACTEVIAFKAKDATEVADIVYREVTDPENPVSERYIGIDSVGVGASTVNHLKRLGVRVRTISGGTRALPTLAFDAPVDEDGESRGGAVVEAERYVNLRSQVFWRLREDLRLGRIALPNDKVLWEELAALEYEEKNGKIQVTPKDKLKATLKRSPNRADAVAYGNWVRARRIRPPKEEKVEHRAREGNRDYGLERIMEAYEERQKRERSRMKRLVRQLKRKAA